MTSIDTNRTNQSQLLANVRNSSEIAMAEAIRGYAWHETSLGASENWPQPLKTLVDTMLSAGQPMFVAWGPERILLYNDAYAPLLVDRHPAALGGPFMAVWPEVEADLTPLFDRVFAGEPVYMDDIELHLDRPGRPREAHFAFSYTPVRNEAGEVIGLFCPCTETTEQVLAYRRRDILTKLDERLRDRDDTAELSFAASELLGEALGAVRVGYGVVDPDERTITVERNWSASGYVSVQGTHNFRDYGAYIEELIDGRTVVNGDVLSDPRTASNTTSFEALGIAAFMDVPVVEGGRLTSEMFVHSGVPRVWAEHEVMLARDVAERTRAAIARRTAELELRTSKARLANALASAHLGTFEWDPTTGKIELDTQARAIFGLSPDAPVEQSQVFGRISREQVGAVEQPALVAAANGERMAFDYDIDLPDGSTRFVRSSCVAIPTPEGERFVGVFQDATELKQAERALRAANETLEERVHERSAELEAAHEQLRQSQKMEAVGQLTGGLAHDFNNLLAGIAGSLELIRMRLAQGRTADVEKYVTAAQGAANRAAALTHRLLAFSRRQTLAPKPTDVKQLVAGMVDLIGRTTGPAIRLELVNGVGLWPSLIDPSQLENAVLNLCINARDAMPDGGAITIETSNRWIDRRMAQERGLEPGQYISLCVSDTGTGMSPDVIAKAFDPFFTTKPIGVGTGLGLSMIYGFAKQSGGSVAIYSELGEGTNVCIYLPRHLGSAEPVDVNVASADLPRGEGETVLVIDDEPTVRMLVTEVLSDLGYHAMEAEDGPAGLKLLNAQGRIDLLVTDVGLPGGMNGRQVADAAREMRPDLKVLFITGYAENAVLSHGHLDPGMHVMTKPFAMDALASRIRELIASD